MKHAQYSYEIHGNMSSLFWDSFMHNSLSFKCILTHWGWDKIAANIWTTFSNASSLIYIVFWLKFHWNFSKGSNYQYSSIGSDNGLAPVRWQAIIWINDGLVYWCIYVSLSLNELNTYKNTIWLNVYWYIIWQKDHSEVLLYENGNSYIHFLYFWYEGSIIHYNEFLIIVTRNDTYYHKVIKDTIKNI